MFAILFLSVHFMLLICVAMLLIRPLFVATLFFFLLLSWSARYFHTYYYCSYFHLTLLFHEHKKNPWGLSVFVLAGFLLSILCIQIKNAHKEQLAESPAIGGLLFIT